MELPIRMQSLVLLEKLMGFLLKKWIFDESVQRYGTAVPIRDKKNIFLLKNYLKDENQDAKKKNRRASPMIIYLLTIEKTIYKRKTLLFLKQKNISILILIKSL